MGFGVVSSVYCSISCCTLKGTFMKHHSILFVASVCFCMNANGEYVRHFDDVNQYSGVPSLLDVVGIGQSNVGAESIYETFTTPSGTSSLTFNYVQNTGSFRFSFGFYQPGSNPYDPVSAKQDWADYAITNSTIVFDDRDDDPGDSRTFSVMGDKQLAFYIIPHNTYAHFTAHPNLFYDLPIQSSPHQSPMFSASDGNRGELDQMLSFSDYTADITLFAFEDMARAHYSGETFSDIGITINTALIPTASASQISDGVVDNDFNGGAQAPIPSTMLLAIPLVFLGLCRPRHKEILASRI